MERPRRAQFHQICRLCLKMTDLVNIFERNPKTLKESLGLLVRETVEMLGLAVDPDDGFPKKMCVSCKDFLRQLYKFRNQCQEANDLLVEAFSAAESNECSQQLPENREASPLPVEPRIHVIPTSSLVKIESDNKTKAATISIAQYDKPVHTEKIPQYETPASPAVEDTILEADSSSSCTKPTVVKIEPIQSQETVDYLESTESFVEEYEYLEVEEQIVHDHNITDEIVQEEYTIDDVQNDSALDEQNIEVVVDEDIGSNDETENDEDERTESDASKPSFSRLAGRECKICGKFSTCMKYHMMCHTGERPFPCSQCDKTFRTNSKLKIHVNGVHLKVRKYTCEICSKKFLDMGNLKNHRVTHGGERKHVCDYEGCGKSFALPGTLTVHKKSHTQDKQFTCEICTKSFLYKWLLVKHLRIHTGEKPYECDVCKKKFSTITHMHTHRRIHNPNREKPARKRKTAVKTKFQPEFQPKREDSDTSDFVVSEN